MYKCENGHRFEEYKTVSQSSEFWGIKGTTTTWACPECYSTDLSELREWDDILEELQDDVNTLVEVIEKYKTSSSKDFREFLEENYD